MDEETAIVDSNTRNEKIRSFFVNNRKLILIILIVLISCLISYFAIKEYRENQRLEISDLYNSIVTEYNEENKEKTKKLLIDLINKNDPTYSPLSLYFIIDNKLITERAQINILFDEIIKDTSLDKEIKNLIIYKKGLYNADDSQENELLEILKPIISSESIWKAQALYLMAEYFYSKDEKQKSKEFFNQILSLKNVNQDIKSEAQKSTEKTKASN